MIRVNSYDIDGVLYMGPTREGLWPGPEDVIITGRSYEQREETLRFLRGRGINNFVFFNPMSRSDLFYGRAASGNHKRNTIIGLREMGVEVVLHFEDDPMQAEVVETITKVVMIGNGEFIGV